MDTRLDKQKELPDQTDRRMQEVTTNANWNINKNTKKKRVA